MISICLLAFICLCVGPWAQAGSQRSGSMDGSAPHTPHTLSGTPHTLSGTPTPLSLKIMEQDTKTRKQTKSDRHFWAPFSGIYSYEHKNCKLAKKSKEHVHLWSCSSIEEQKKIQQIPKIYCLLFKGLWVQCLQSFSLWNEYYLVLNYSFLSF